MHSHLFGSRGSNLSDVLGAVGSMTAAVELALVALVLRLSAILDAVTFSSAVETFVVSWQRVSFTLALLLFIPREGTNVFFGSWSRSSLC